MKTFVTLYELSGTDLYLFEQKRHKKGQRRKWKAIPFFFFLEFFYNLYVVDESLADPNRVPKFSVSLFFFLFLLFFFIPHISFKTLMSIFVWEKSRKFVCQKVVRRTGKRAEKRFLTIPTYRPGGLNRD